MGIDVRALIEGDAKLIRTRITPRAGGPPAVGALELYDLASDAAERVDRSRFDAELAGRLSSTLDEAEQRLDSLAPAPETLELDEGARERLRALGYL